MNERLLTEAERLENVQVVFGHKLLKCDVLNGVLTFLVSGKEKNVASDIIIGADGVYSQVRTGLMRSVKYFLGLYMTDGEWISHRIISIACGANSKFLHPIRQLNGAASK